MKEKKIVIFGMARSGVAAAKLLCRHGARVLINDRKTEAELGDALDELRTFPGVEWRLGEPVEPLLDGTDMLLISPGIAADHPAARKARAMGVEVAGELEVALRLARGRLIAITGTNGKSTTTTLVGEIIRNAGKIAHVVGNIGRAVSEIAFESRPEDVIVCEVSSFQLETVRDFHPEICAVLNISEDHLDRHGTMENYIGHKARIFANQGEGDARILNWDDPALRALDAAGGGRRLWFSRRETPPCGAFVRDGNIVYGDKETSRTICPLDEIALPGAHNLENALAAAAISMAAGVPAPVIRHTLRTFRGVEHRLETVREFSGIRYINDSKGTNVESTLKAVETMDRPTVLMLGGRNPGADFTRLAEALGASFVRSAVLLGEAAPEIQKALDHAGFGRYENAGDDFQAALEKARALARPGMNVLLSPACKSFDLFSDYEERGRAFKRLVNELS